MFARCESYSFIPREERRLIKFVPMHTMKVCGEWGYSSTHS
jgi:hypothetical protein